MLEVLETESHHRVCLWIVIVSCRDFWNAKDSWYPTWAADSNNGEQAAMAIDYVRVYQDSN